MYKNNVQEKFIESMNNKYQSEILYDDFKNHSYQAKSMGNGYIGGLTLV